MLIINLHYTDDTLWPEGTPAAPDLDRERSVEAFECIVAASIGERYPHSDVRFWRGTPAQIDLTVSEPAAPDALERVADQVKSILARVQSDRDAWEVSMPEIQLPPVTLEAIRAGHPIDLPLPIWTQAPVYILQTPPDDPEDRYLFVQVGDRVADVSVYPLFSKSGRPVQWGHSSDPAFEAPHRLRVADTALGILAHYFRETVSPESINSDQLASIYYVRGFVRDILLTANGRHDLMVTGLQVEQWLQRHRLSTSDLLRRLRPDGPGLA